MVESFIAAHFYYILHIQRYGKINNYYVWFGPSFSVRTKSNSRQWHSRELCAFNHLLTIDYRILRIPRSFTESSILFMKQ